MTVLIRKALLGMSLGLAAILWFAYYALYFKWRNCFNELGRCFDSNTGVVYLEQSKDAWLPLALLASCISLYQLWRLAR